MNIDYVEDNLDTSRFSFKNSHSLKYFSKIKFSISISLLLVVASFLLTSTTIAAPDDISINSTSVNRATPPDSAVPQYLRKTLRKYQILSSNDLGMHCTDADHRIISILPPADNPHVQVLQRGRKPTLLGPDEVEVVYSAAANPKDPALMRPVADSVFKINIWDKNTRTGNPIIFDAYDPLYPPGVLGMFPLLPDIGLPFPEVERLYLGDGKLVALQTKMPGFEDPYVVNDRQHIEAYVKDFPLFINFPFGYVSKALNYFSGEGIPISPFDDFGRRNSYPLMRYQALDKTGALTGEVGKLLASVDAVLPVSDETRCETCHGDQEDGGFANRAADVKFGGSPWSKTKFPVKAAFEDPKYGDVPLNVSVEWAVDQNILGLHDAKHGSKYQSSCDPVANPADPNCLINRTPIVCQTCHYSPALDLVQLGPNNENGKEQGFNVTMSRAMHGFHGALIDPDTNKRLLRDMPPPNDPRRIGASGNPVINKFVNDTLSETCYNCHPGNVTQCLRGAMYDGGMVCQDCHGQPRMVGNDFSRDVGPETPGQFLLANDFYTNADTLRVPWANEPGCGSCHTGDAMENMTDSPHTIPSPKGIRLLQAFKGDDPNAKPIVPKNKRFAENVVPVNDLHTKAKAGNPMLYRVSKGHGGLLCENCHGPTHSIYPVKPDSGPFVANENIASIQHQGHSGVVMECETCHGDTMKNRNTLDGPHGMHPVGGGTFTDGGHAKLGEEQIDECRACHGKNGMGTVLSRVATDRSFVIDKCESGTLCPDDGEEPFRVNLTKGETITCVMCHKNQL